MNRQPLKTSYRTVDLTIQDIRKELNKFDKIVQQPGLEQLIYLLLGPIILENWLQEFPIEIPYHYKKHSLCNPLQGLITEFISGLQLGRVKLCLLVSDRIETEILEIPDIALNHPTFAAHLYLFIYLPGEELITSYTHQELLVEKTITASILGFIRHDQIIQEKKGIQYNSLGYYEIPQISLDPNFNHLKTSACLVEPTRIFSPPLNTQQQQTEQTLNIEKKIKQFAEQPYLNERYIWRNLHLSPSELDYFFSNSNLRQSFAQIILKESLKNQQKYNPSQERIINLSQWLLAEVNDFVEQTIQVITPYNFVSTFYDIPQSSDLESNFAIYQLKERIRELLGEQEIPELNTKIGLLPLNLDGQELQLLVGTWITEASQAECNWNLLFILAAGSPLGFSPKTSVKIENNFGASETIMLFPSESSYLILLSPTLKEKIKILISIADCSYTQSFIFQES